MESLITLDLELFKSSLLTENLQLTKKDKNQKTAPLILDHL